MIDSIPHHTQRGHHGSDGHHETRSRAHATGEFDYWKEHPMGVSAGFCDDQIEFYKSLYEELRHQITALRHKLRVHDIPMAEPILEVLAKHLDKGAPLESLKHWQNVIRHLLQALTTLMAYYIRYHPGVLKCEHLERTTVPVSFEVSDWTETDHIKMKQRMNITTILE